jgi:uncharacterized protein
LEGIVEAMKPMFVAMSEAKQYLYRIIPTRPNMLSEGLTLQESEVIAKHFVYLQKLIRDGILILAGRTLNTDEDSFGISVIKANTEEEACEIMNNDPAVKLGVVNAKLFPYRVALISEAYAQ